MRNLAFLVLNKKDITVCFLLYSSPDRKAMQSEKKAIPKINKDDLMGSLLPV